MVLYLICSYISINLRSLTSRHALNSNAKQFFLRFPHSSSSSRATYSSSIARVPPHFSYRTKFYNTKLYFFSCAFISSKYPSCSSHYCESCTSYTPSSPTILYFPHHPHIIFPFPNLYASSRNSISPASTTKIWHKHQYLPSRVPTRTSGSECGRNLECVQVSGPLHRPAGVLCAKGARVLRGASPRSPRIPRSAGGVPRSRHAHPVPVHSLALRTPGILFWTYPQLLIPLFSHLSLLLAYFIVIVQIAPIKQCKL